MSKKEKKLREEEHLKILKNITSKNSIQVPLEPLQKAKQYSNMISELEKCVKYFPDSDKKENYYKKYVSKIEELSEEASEIYFSNNKYEECIDLSKNLLKYNNKNDKAIVRLYKSYWNLGDKESAVIYGSFLYLRCDKKTQDKYKQLIPEIKQNFKKVAEEYKNKSFLSEIKISKKMIFRFIFFIICIIYIIRNYKDLNSFF